MEPSPFPCLSLSLAEASAVVEGASPPAHHRAGILAFEHIKGDIEMLDLSCVGLDDLCSALEDHSYEHSWWFDP